MLEYLDCCKYPKWKLFDSRRATVKEVFKKKGIVPRKERKVLAAFFNVSESAVYQDFIYFNNQGSSSKICPTLREKENIFKRDGRVCCYCGSKESENYVIEHVVPTISGGTCDHYNLVVSCWSCNMSKKSQTWIPCNLEDITENNPEWRDKVVALAAR